MLGTLRSTRQPKPSSVAGTICFAVPRRTISSGLSKWWTATPETAQNAVTSTTSVAGTKPFEPTPLGCGVIRTTIQSLPCGAYAPTGIVTDANPSAESSVIAEPELAFA